MADDDVRTGGSEEDRFNQRVEEVFDEKVVDFSKSLKIVIVGRVSTGKSSLINALLRRDRSNQVLEVGATSGTTTERRILRLDERTLLIDSPGLEDVQEENSEKARELLSNVDVGILVVTGSADSSQKKHLDDLRRTARRTFVALNKIDQWDKHAPSAREAVIEQWKTQLGLDVIYPVSAFGYDPHTRPDVPLDIRGVDKLRDDLEAYLESEGKVLLLARHMGEKKEYAAGVIAGALVAVGAEAFIPGSAVYITATQAAAICSLYYLYTGRILPKTAALAILPSFAARSIGTTLFLWVKSFLPPTGILDVAAATLAVTVTLAMLVAVNRVLVHGHELRERELLQREFTGLRSRAKEILSNSGASDWKTRGFWSKLLQELLS